MRDLSSATEEMLGFMEMVMERQPSLRPAIEAKAQEMADELAEMFRPYTDLAEGKITVEEFEAIVAKRVADDERQRRLKWRQVDYDDPTSPWLAVCMTCDREVEVEDLPPLYFECDDCEEEERLEHEAMEADGEA